MMEVFHDDNYWRNFLIEGETSVSFGNSLQCKELHSFCVVYSGPEIFPVENTKWKSFSKIISSGSYQELTFRGQFFFPIVHHNSFSL